MSARERERGGGRGEEANVGMAAPTDFLRVSACLILISE